MGLEAEIQGWLENMRVCSSTLVAATGTILNPSCFIGVYSWCDVRIELAVGFDPPLTQAVWSSNYFVKVG